MGFLRRRQAKSVDLEARSPELGIKNKDLLVLKQLVDHGADLTAPRHVLHYMYFSDDQAARTAAAEITSPFSATITEAAVESSAPMSKWLMLCEAHDYTLSPENVRTDTDFFEALASRCNGDYDGWEASV
ncbi:MAG: ribonuclease E inhibitor RraB [Acidimicrobiales bacterium]